MRLKLLFNPAAGRGRGARVIERAVEYLKSRGAEVTLLRSESPEHLTELAASKEGGRFDRLVICGGDGTLNLAVRRLDLTTTTLGIIPFGTGDDLAGALGIPNKLEPACDVILGGAVREIDVAEVNGVRFLGVAGIGFDSVVARWVNDNRTLFRGSLLYVYAILRVLPRFTPIRIALEVDDVRRAETIMFAVFGNSHRYGGGIAIAPEALLDDGRLHAYLFNKASRWDLLTTLPLAYSGRHIRKPFVTMLSGSHFEVDSEETLDVYADGERLSGTPATIGIGPQRLRVSAPARIPDPV